MSKFNNNIHFCSDDLRCKRFGLGKFGLNLISYYLSQRIKNLEFFELIKDSNMARIVSGLLKLNLLDIMESGANAAKNQNIFGSALVIKNPLFYGGKLNIEIDNRLSEINKYLEGLIKVFFDKIIEIIFPDNNGENGEYFFDVFCEQSNIS